MKTKLEFNPPALMTATSPWTLPAASSYKDLILKPELDSRRYKFPLGSTWFRVVPALRGSVKGWMLGVQAIQYPGGRHAHPRTVVPGAKSVFDHAYRWFSENRKNDLFSKQNKTGHRFLTDPVCLFWMLVEENGQTVARLMLCSGYDGSRGGVAGLGHQIWKLTRELDEDGNPLGNPSDPVSGTQICVEKSQPPGARFPSYKLRMGRVPAPIDDMLAKMDPAEVDAITPLEQVIHLPSEEEEWKLLGHLLDAETLETIRDSLG